MEKLQAEATDIKKPLGDSFFDGMNEWQAWYIYLGLSRLELVDPLAPAVRNLASRIRKHYNW